MDFLYKLGFNPALAEEIAGTIGCQDLKTEFYEFPGDLNDNFVFGAYTHKDGSGGRQDGLRRFLGFVESKAEGVRQSEHFTCGPHFRSEQRIDLGEHIEWEY